ncbi:hypothetical protein HNQ79_000644 [Streptomyces candidus]|uniref:Uncharacterized protein n=1 Tax=Streptomyces candidus TaxID=67283 RepID=A0A7X0HAP7_9ACTN|nr:hypothetical protein [Streptomyces candidus]
MPTPSPTSIMIGGVKSATFARCEASAIRATELPTANRAVSTGRLAAISEPKRNTRITSAPRTPAPSAAPPPPSSALRAAPPPTAAVTPSPSTASTAAMTRRTSSAGTSCSRPSSVTVAYATVPLPETAARSSYGLRTSTTRGSPETSRSIPSTLPRTAGSAMPRGAPTTTCRVASACADPCSSSTDCARWESVPGSEKSLW